MKKYLFIVYTLLLISCSNDQIAEESEDVNKVYPISFNLSALTSQIDDFKSTLTKSAETNIKAFFIFIYNEEGKYVTHIENRNVLSSNDLNNLIKIPKGNYTAVGIAFNQWDEQLQLDTEINELVKYDIDEAYIVVGTEDYYYCTVPNSSKQLLNFNLSKYDYFYNKVNFTVNSESNLVNLVLPRLTGRVEFHFTDIKPVNVNSKNETDVYAVIRMASATVGIRFDDWSHVYYLVSSYLSRKDWNNLVNNPLVFNVREKTDMTLYIDILDEDKPILENSYAPNVVHTYTFEGINVYKNKITRLTGKLKPEAGFKPILNEKWDDIIDINL